MRTLKIAENTSVKVSAHERDNRSPYVIKSLRNYTYPETYSGRLIHFYDDLHFIVSSLKNNQITTQQLLRMGAACGFSESSMKKDVLKTLLTAGHLTRMQKGLYRIDFLTASFSVPSQKANEIIKDTYGTQLVNIKDNQFIQVTNNFNLSNSDTDILTKAAEYAQKHGVDLPAAILKVTKKPSILQQVLDL